MEVLTALEKLYDRFGKEYRSGEVVFSEGESGTDMFYVLAGSVDVVKRPVDGKPEVVLAKMAMGDFFGEMSLLLAETRSATVRASTEKTRVIRISPGNFDTIVKLQPQIAIEMLKALARRLRATSRMAVE